MEAQIGSLLGNKSDGNLQLSLKQILREIIAALEK